MPIYQYQCAACGHQLEALQKISDPKMVDCPACHQPELKKQLTAAAFQLKGTGWYETDFKNSGKPKSNSTAVEQESGNDDKGKPVAAKNTSDSGAVSDSTETASAPAN